MASQIDKIWNRSWNIEEIIENADNWTLAGDVALLNTLKSYADDMFKKTESITNNIDGLLNNVDEVQLKLDITQNEFYSLKNSQFIESRVYEDDETLDSKENEKFVAEQITEDRQEKLICESIKVGIDVIQKYYDDVEVSISDSEDESEKSYIIKPKDVYIHRPLPPLYGSGEWNKKWHMEDISSDSESDKVSETYSESDYETNLPKDSLKGSETSSELEFSSNIVSETRPIDNSTFNEPSKKIDSISSSDGSNGFRESEPVKMPTINKSFLEQVSRTLTNVKSQQEDDTYEKINKTSIQPLKSDFIDYLFSDKPPPLDNLEDDKSSKPSHSGIFSGGYGLFDDEDTKDFWETTNIETKINQDEERSDFVYKSVQQKSKGLFDSDDDDNIEDDLFATNFKRQSIEGQSEKTYNASTYTHESEILKKKPVGGVLLCGSLDMFKDQQVKDILSGNKSIKVQGKIEDKDEVPVNNKINLFEENQTSIGDITSGKKKMLDHFNDDGHETKVTSSKNTKKISLFDDDDDEDIMKNDIFAGISSSTSNVFDDSVGNNDIFEIENQTKSHGVIKTQVDSLFSDFDEKDKNVAMEIRGSLFDESEGVKPITVPKMYTKKLNEDSVDFSISNLNVTVSGSNIVDCVEKAEVFTHDQVDKSEKNISKLDDLFEKSVSLKSPVATASIIENKLDIGLFESTPPPVDDHIDDDDEWETKSENSNFADFLLYRAGDDIKQSDLFNNEPPSLYFNDTSGIEEDFKNTGKLSSEILGEQQSQNSFSITKNHTTPISIAPNPKTSYTSALLSDDVDVFQTIDVEKVEEGQNLFFESKDKDKMKLFETKSQDGTIKESLPRCTNLDGQIISRLKESSDILSEPKSLIISGLKQNLNINVNALRPSTSYNQIKQIISNTNSIVRQNDDVTKSIVSAEKAVSFDDDIGDKEYLPSITKNRAKIPIKRKPSTRRGRQQEIRKSMVEVLSDVDDFIQVQNLSTVPDVNINVAAANEESKVSIGTHESLSPPVITNVKSVKNDNIFNEDDKDIVLFSNTSDKFSLFDSEDDTETDLFGQNTFQKMKRKASQKKVLFDDSSSDDDLFGMGSSNNKSNHEGFPEKIVKKSQKCSIVRKLENVEATDNPLFDVFK